MVETTRYSHEQAQAEAALTQLRAENNPAQMKIIEQVTLMSRYPKEKLQNLITADINEFPTEQRVAAPQIKKAAQLALEIQNDPSLVAELITDQSHPRILDIISASIDRDKQENPELFALDISKASMIRELIVALGSGEKVQELTTDLKEKAKLLSEANSQMPDILSGVPFSEVAVSLLKRDPKYQTLAMTPEMWGNVYALVEVDKQIAELLKSEQK